MINLPYLGIDEKQLLNQIILSKQSSNRTVLENVKSAIFEDYDDYSDNEMNLENMEPDNRIGNEEKELLHASYKQGKRISEIKESIKKSMPDAIQEKCPYCMLSEPTTLDHYLDKGTFPEYSVYVKNLVPCCSYCNSLKGSKFLSGSGKRMFISFYFDEIPQTSFLKIYIGIKDNIPYIEQFAIDFEEEKEVNEIIETHYAELKLFERYKLPISNRLSSLFYELRTYEEYSVDKLKEVIELRIQTIEKIYGKNYWEVCLYKGVLKNEELLELLCEK